MPSGSVDPQRGSSTGTSHAWQGAGSPRKGGLETLLRTWHDDEHLLDVAVRASLRGINLDPVPIEVAMEDPRNRKAISRAMQALAREILGPEEA